MLRGKAERLCGAANKRDTDCCVECIVNVHVTCLLIAHQKLFDLLLEAVFACQTLGVFDEKLGFVFLFLWRCRRSADCVEWLEECKIIWTLSQTPHKKLLEHCSFQKPIEEAASRCAVLGFQEARFGVSFRTKVPEKLHEELIEGVGYENVAQFVLIQGIDNLERHQQRLLESFRQDRRLVAALFDDFLAFQVHNYSILELNVPQNVNGIFHDANQHWNWCINQVIKIIRCDSDDWMEPLERIENREQAHQASRQPRDVSVQQNDFPFQQYRSKDRNQQFLGH